MRIKEYNREKAVEYANKWWLKRNPSYYNFDAIGGNCTNFASQCLFYGAPVMNYTKDIGWYYKSANDRSAAWTGVEFFYNFLIANNPQNGEIGNGVGPFGINSLKNGLKIGDFVQFGNISGEFYHTGIIVGFRATEPLISTNSANSYAKPVSLFVYDKIRYIKILGYKDYELN